MVEDHTPGVWYPEDVEENSNIDSDSSYEVTELDVTVEGAIDSFFDIISRFLYPGLFLFVIVMAVWEGELSSLF